MQCVRAAKIEPEAMMIVGMAYNNAATALAEMQDGDVLIVFHPSDGNLPNQSKDKIEAKAK